MRIMPKDIAIFSTFVALPTFFHKQMVYFIVYRYIFTNKWCISLFIATYSQNGPGSDESEPFVHSRWCAYRQKIQTSEKAIHWRIQNVSIKRNTAQRMSAHKDWIFVATFRIALKNFVLMDVNKARTLSYPTNHIDD